MRMNLPKINANGNSSLDDNSGVQYPSPSFTFSTVSNTIHVLPNQQVNVNKAPSCSIFTYYTKLDFAKPACLTPMCFPMVVNIADCLHKWIMHTHLLTNTFLLLPSDEETDGHQGHLISHEDQLPKDDIMAYSPYYHNHWVDPHGHLTIMVNFSCNLPWGKLKE